ncbi:MAG: HD domain-containing phosphohydrolase [Dehalococcoidia bacterium]
MHRIRLAASWLARSASYPARHIRWKIIAPYAVLTVLLAVAGTYLTTRLVTGSLEERFNNQLAEASRVAADAVVRRERRHLEVVRAVAFTDGVSEATQSGDASQLSRLVEPIAANSSADRVEVLDATGARVLGLQRGDDGDYEVIAADDIPGEWSIVRDVRAGRQDELGDKFAQLVHTGDGYALYTSGPIYDGDRLAGVALVGSLLHSFLPAVKNESLADVTLYDFDGTPLATTFAGAEDEGADLAPRGDIASTTSLEGLREHRTLSGRDFDLLYAELKIRNTTVGVYSVGLPTSFIFNAGTATRWQLGGLFAVATAAVLMTGWLLARGMTRPLIQLVSAARAVTSGDLTARAAVASPDEIGVLGTAFDAMTERLQRQHLATIRALTSAIDARDPHTLGHSVRVGQLAMAIGHEMGLPDSQLQHLEIGGYLHDIGKIGVRDAVLLKPGSLTAEEREMIERHPRIGLEILAPVELAPEVIEFVAGHHEKLDGSGYPGHLHAQGLSIIARIAAVADIYDALTTDRPYRTAMDLRETMDILRREVEERHLDAKVVSAFTRILPEWESRRTTDPTLKGYRLPDVHVKAA